MKHEKCLRPFSASDFAFRQDQAAASGAGFPEQAHQLHGEFEIPCLEEVLALTKRKSAENGLAISVYVET